MRIAFFSPRVGVRPRLGVLFRGFIVDLVTYYRDLYGFEPPSYLFDLGEFLGCRYSRVVVEEILSSVSGSVDGVFNHGLDDVIYYPLTSIHQRVFVLLLIIDLMLKRLGYQYLLSHMYL